VILTPEELKRQFGTKSKYGNKKCELDGFTFDSRKEMRRYVKLKAALEAGVITQLEVHPLYRLSVVGVGIEVFRYTPDFRYRRDGQLVVEDVKSKPTKTEAYGMRKRLMRALYGIEVIDV
jgi:hypothetical protein